MISSKTIILASGSPYRQQLLQQLELSFICRSPDIDETPRLEEPIRQLVERLSLEKALAIQETEPSGIIIGSDQSAELDGIALTKPITENKAVDQLTMCSGRTVRFFTGLCVLGPHGFKKTSVITTEVEFRQLSLQQIRTYIKRESPLDCAGSFKCEGLGISLFKAIRSDDPTALVGLPLITLTHYLQDAGVDIITTQKN